MTKSLAEVPYSFSMINLVKLMPKWSWDGFDQVMIQAGTTKVELVPSMLLGMDWDEQIERGDHAFQNALERFMQRYTVGSIQSLTYGLEINLADNLFNDPKLLKRMQNLGTLAKMTGCSVLILGSPGQKKLEVSAMSRDDSKRHFMANCSWMASILGPGIVLSLEHNTKEQGAEVCNTIAEIISIVNTLRSNRVTNIGLNLDTKCLIHEFGENMHVDRFLDDPEVAGLITSIQISFDFLTRAVPHRAEDQHLLLDFARAREIPLSLEEFGLLSSQITPFIKAWKSL